MTLTQTSSIVLLLTLLLQPLWGSMVNLTEPNASGRSISSTKRICIQGFPEAHNPSICDSPWGLLLTFRSVPNISGAPWISELGILVLNENLDPLTPPQLISTRDNHAHIPQQSEDARIFKLNGKVFLAYNDNMDIIDPKPNQRRDMYIAELQYENGRFFISEPLKLYHETLYDKVNWQKNWVPFEWNHMLLMGYSINPHEIICPSLNSGKCNSKWSTHLLYQWDWGTLRGGTPAQIVDNEYLAFFHSATVIQSNVSNGRKMWHYYMGAYTFSANPPFCITKITPSPIIAPNFYTNSHSEKRVVFPGGYIVRGPLIHVAYGKDDKEVWIATIRKEELMRSLQTIKPIQIPLEQSIRK